MLIIPTLPTILILVLRFQNQNYIDLVFLINDFQQKYKEWLRFFLLFNNETTRFAIYKYQIKIDNVIIYLNYVYRSYNLFTYLCKLKIVSKNNLIIVIVFAIDIFCLDQFDLIDICFSFIYSVKKKYLKCITEGKIPKYSISHKMS